MVTSGTVRCRSMGAVKGRIERAEHEEEVSKVRQGFSKEKNHYDWAGVSVAIEPTPSGS